MGNRLSPLDVELLTALRKFGWMSGPQLALFTGAHGSTVKKRLYRLRGSELVDRSTVTTYTNLRGVHRLADMDLVSVWYCTRAGLRRLGPIEDVPGSGAQLKALPVVKNVGQSQAISHHLAVVDHACVFRAYGAALASEREIRASEQELHRRDAKAQDHELRARRFWIAVAGRWDAADGAPPSHTPDLGVAFNGGASGYAAVEVELAVKAGATYLAAVKSMHDSGIPQWWFPMQRAARERLVEQAGTVAAGRERVVDGRPVAWESEDGKIRVFPSLWNGGWNSADLASFDPKGVYASMLNPLTGGADAHARVDLRAFWMRRPDVAALAQRTKAARAMPTIQPMAPAVPLLERVAILRDASVRAVQVNLAPGAYTVAEGMVADWDGVAFRNPRAA